MSACTALEGALAGGASVSPQNDLDVALAVVELREALFVTDQNRAKLNDVAADLYHAATDRTRAASD